MLALLRRQAWSVRVTEHTFHAPVHRPITRRIIDQLRDITSGVQWITFNEGWSDYDEVPVIDLTNSLDPTRLVNGSGESIYLVAIPVTATSSTTTYTPVQTRRIQRGPALHS